VNKKSTTAIHYIWLVDINNRKKEFDRHVHRPLCYALAHKQSEKVILKLINEFPEAVAETNAFHIGCKCGHSDKVVMKLINTYPQALRKADSDGSYLLHHVCQYSQS
jgi:hypothetical protein